MRNENKKNKSLQANENRFSTDAFGDFDSKEFRILDEWITEDLERIVEKHQSFIILDQMELMAEQRGANCEVVQ